MLTHATVFGHIIVVVQCTNCHVHDVTTAIGATSNGNQREDKRAQNSTTEMSFCKIIISLSQCTTAITPAYNQNFRRPFPQAVRFLYITLHNMDQFFPTRSVTSHKTQRLPITRMLSETTKDSARTPPYPCIISHEVVTE